MKFVTLSLTSKIVTTENGGWKNWASCHPSKPVRHGCLNRPPESQNRVQTIRADTPLVAHRSSCRRKGAGDVRQRLTVSCIVISNPLDPRT